MNFAINEEKKLFTLKIIKVTMTCCSSLAFFFFQAFFLDEAGDSATGVDVIGDESDDIVVV